MLFAFYPLHLTLIHLHEIVETVNIPGKLVGRIRTLRGLDLTRRPDFGERCYRKYLVHKMLLLVRIHFLGSERAKKVLHTAYHAFIALPKVNITFSTLC